MKADDIVADVTAKIIAHLENGVQPWVRPWSSNGMGWPNNPISKVNYTGFNAIWLNMSALPYKTNLWMTFAQARDAGGMVRKGEKATNALRPIEITRAFNQEAGAEAAEKLLLFRGYSLFNLDQVDGLDHLYPEPVTLRDHKPHERADRIIAATEADIRHGGHQCYYMPRTDHIQMVEPERFSLGREYYATMFHELAHWTGAEHRLNRLPGIISRESPEYGREELVAELCSAFCCQLLHIDGLDRHNAAYIDGWLQMLREDKKAILTAAAASKKALEWIIPAEEFQPKPRTAPAIQGPAPTM